MVEVYKNFELMTMSPVFKTLMWRRRFSHAGEFQLVTNFTAEMFEIFGLGNIVYHRKVDEAAFVESRHVVQTVENDLVLVVRGRFLPSILDRRVATAQGHFTLQNLLTNIVNHNFLASAGARRSMAGSVRLLPFTLPSINVAADYHNRNAYEMVSRLLEEHGLGIRAAYNFATSTIDLSFYQPQETEVVFSKQFSNIIEQDYMDDTQPYRNVVFVREGDTIHIHNDALHTGINRREMSTSAASNESPAQAAIDALRQNQGRRTLSSVVNPFNKQFEYLTDWDIGSIVQSENRELAYSEREVVTEITEYYDSTGLNIEVNLGDIKERGIANGYTNRT